MSRRSSAPHGMVSKTACAVGGEGLQGRTLLKWAKHLQSFADCCI